MDSIVAKLLADLRSLFDGVGLANNRARFSRTKTRAAGIDGSSTPPKPRPSYLSYVALDFDGVLHPGQAETFVHMQAFAAWLRQHPWVGVVISSSWRAFMSLEDFKPLFPADLRERVVGVTPDLPDSRREDEIDAFFVERGVPHANWVALDDDERGFLRHKSRLIQTRYTEGLRPEHLLELARRLGA